MEINFLTPVASRHPLSGECRLPLRSSRASPLLRLFIKSLVDADDAALMRLFIELRVLVNDGKHVDQMHIFCGFRKNIYICRVKGNSRKG